ncbi:MAG: ABC transporter permease, partial [Clostridiales bacterium]|nr:ABC transporter permease [Clostridiales bacterium]
MKLNRKTALIAVNALLLILIGLCLLRCKSYGNLLLSQQAADFWAGASKERFSQVSCFFPVTAPADENAIRSFRKTIDKKLADAGIEPKNEGQYWTDAYSAIGSIKVESSRGSADTTAIGVGGNFFMFHPYRLRSGGYIYDSDIMNDRVVLDYDLAWKLFGSTQLEGMSVNINGKPYYIAGVVEREKDKFSRKAFKGEPVIFMSYSALLELSEKTGIVCYEVAMPNPISNFAENLVKEGFASYKPAVVENSERYSFINIYNIFKNFGSRSVQDSGIAYPYWENAARISEVYIARLYVIIALLLLFPMICLAILTVRLIKYLNAKLKILKFKIWDAWDDRYARRALRKEKRELRRTVKASCSGEEAEGKDGKTSLPNRVVSKLAGIFSNMDMHRKIKNRKKIKTDRKRLPLRRKKRLSDIEHKALTES